MHILPLLLDCTVLVFDVQKVRHLWKYQDALWMNTIHIIYCIFLCISRIKILLIALHFIAGIYIHTQPGTWGCVVKQNNMRVIKRQDATIAMLKKNYCNVEFMHEVSTHIPVTGWLLIIMIKFRKCTSWAHGAYFSMKGIFHRLVVLDTMKRQKWGALVSWKWNCGMISTLNLPIKESSDTWGPMCYMGRLPPKGYLFQPSGIWKGKDFTSWGTWKGMKSVL